MSDSQKLPPLFDWGLSSLGCAEMDLASVIELAQRFGVRSLELRALEDVLNLPAYFRRTFGEPAELARWLEGKPIEIKVLDTSLKLVGATDKAKAAFLEFVPWAEALGTPWLRVFDGGKLGSEPDPELIAQATQTIDWWRRERKRRSLRVDIAMETHDGFCAASRCVALQQSLQTPLPIIWDSHHTFHKMDEPIEKTWQALRTFVVHIHFKDSVATPNATNDYTCVPPGEGRFPVAQLFTLLREANFSHTVCLEWERKWQPAIPPLETALAAAASVAHSIKS